MYSKLRQGLKYSKGKMQKVKCQIKLEAYIHMWVSLVQIPVQQDSNFYEKFKEILLNLA